MNTGQCHVRQQPPLSSVTMKLMPLIFSRWKFRLLVKQLSATNVFRCTLICCDFLLQFTSYRRTTRAWPGGGRKDKQLQAGVRMGHDAVVKGEAFSFFTYCILWVFICQSALHCCSLIWKHKKLHIMIWSVLIFHNSPYWKQWANYAVGNKYVSPQPWVDISSTA